MEFLILFVFFYRKIDVKILGIFQEESEKSYHCKKFSYEKADF